jgi:hypothetical protein
LNGIGTSFGKSDQVQLFEWLNIKGFLGLSGAYATTMPLRWLTSSEFIADLGTV